MNWCNIVTIYLKELRDSLRDRRTVISMIVIPTLVMPVLVFGVGKIAMGVFAKAKNEVDSIMVRGGKSKKVAVVEEVE